VNLSKEIKKTAIKYKKKQVFCFVTHLKVKNKHLGKKIHMFSLTEYQHTGGTNSLQ